MSALGNYGLVQTQISMVLVVFCGNREKKKKFTRILFAEALFKKRGKQKEMKYFS